MNHETTDQDGNVIREGMAVMSGGDMWVVGYAAPSLIALDRIRPCGGKERRILGRKRFCCIHIIGYEIPRVFN